MPALDEPNRDLGAGLHKYRVLAVPLVYSVREGRGPSKWLEYSRCHRSGLPVTPLPNSSSTVGNLIDAMGTCGYCFHQSKSKDSRRLQPVLAKQRFQASKNEAVDRLSKVQSVNWLIDVGDAAYKVYSACHAVSPSPTGRSST